MTATPERTDGFNVFELFHYNVPYEIRLHHALEAEMLCPVPLLRRCGRHL